MYSTEPPMAVQAKPVTVPEGKLPSYSRSDVKTCPGMWWGWWGWGKMGWIWFNGWRILVSNESLMPLGWWFLMYKSWSWGARSPFCHPQLHPDRATGFPTYSVKAASSTRNSIGEGSAVSFSDASPSVVPPLLFEVLWGHREVQKVIFGCWHCSTYHRKKQYSVELSYNISTSPNNQPRAICLPEISTSNQ